MACIGSCLTPQEEMNVLRRWVERDRKAIQQLRFQLFRERAMNHALNAEYFDTRNNPKAAARHRRAHSRFLILADSIKAGER
jgi:hypothetical protein